MTKSVRYVNDLPLIPINTFKVGEIVERTGSRQLFIVKIVSFPKKLPVLIICEDVNGQSYTSSANYYLPLHKDRKDDAKKFLLEYAARKI